MMQLTAIHTNCSGCGVCRQVCALENFREVNPAKALLRVEGRFPSPGDYRVHVCDQCGACADACPDEAIAKRPDGIVVIDDALCSGCQTCIEACPYDAIDFDDNKNIAQSNHDKNPFEFAKPQAHQRLLAY